MSVRLAAALAVALAAAPAARAAGLDPCVAAVGKAVVSYAKGKQKTIAKCEDKRSKGDLDASVLCRQQCVGGSNPGAPCRLAASDCTGGGTCTAPTDPKTADKLDKLAGKVAAQINKKCTALPAVGPACDSAGTLGDLEDCITEPVQDTDVDLVNVDTLSGTVYDGNAPVTDAGLQKCQATISKNVGKYLTARMKAGQKCQTKLGGGKIPGPCPNSDAAAANAKALGKLDAGLRKSCTEAQLAASMPPKLDFGRPCEVYKLVTFKRDDSTTNNSIPVLDRLIRCIADATAGVADRMLDIPFHATDASAFAEGVAAGDATDTAVVFWTRLPDASMGAELDVATDPGFTSGLQTINVSAPAGADDGTVKEDVGSLLPNTTYYYRFRQGTQTSPVGRVTTTPSPSDAAVIHLGWSGDSNAFYRPYTSLDPIRLLAPDAWLYIGDTIYGDDPDADGIVAMTLPEYQGKYRTNRTDPALRHIMQSVGTYAQWDDHEVRNDFAGAVAAFATRMAAGNQAFRDYMPLRESMSDAMQLYRSVQWGTAAEFFLIDDRQYRSAKYTCCNTASESGFVTTDSDSTCTGGGAGEALLPSMSCTTAMADSSRTILGTAQKTWLENGLMNSAATFKFIMNGPPITQLQFLPYDRWEAWTAERTEILDFIESNNIKNVVWLSTDLHAIVVSPVRVDTADTHHVPELVAGAIGETTLFRELPPTIVGLLSGVPGILTQLSEYDIDRYNTVLITVDPTGAMPTANFDFYDRTGAIIHTISFTATP